MKKAKRNNKRNKPNTRPEVTYVMDMQRIPKKVMQEAQAESNSSKFVKILPKKKCRNTFEDAVQLDSLRSLAEVYHSLPKSHGGSHARAY